MYGISALSLAEQFNISYEEAEGIYSDFYKAYPTMAKWFKATNHKANTLGYVETAWNRKRRFMGHKEIAKQYLSAHQQIVAITKTEDYDLRNDKRIPYALKKAIYEVRSDFNRVQRQSVNAVIQGSASDIMKLAMIAVYDLIKEKGPDYKFLATVHDEILIEVPATDVESMEEIAETMRTAVALSIPMKVDVEVSRRWGCGMSFKDYLAEMGE